MTSRGFSRAGCRLVGVVLLLALSACSGHRALPERQPDAEWVASANFDTRRPQLIVLHHTDMASAASALRTLRTRNQHGRVSAHYLIGRDGTLYQLVDDEKRAWHAGASRWGDLTDLNSASIGIELDYDSGGDIDHAPDYPPAQIERLIQLLRDLSVRLQIPPQAVVGHGDIAPTRKSDPGIRFPWAQLAQAGFGWWPRATLAPPPDGFDAWAALRLIGYDLREPAAALRAFHRHYRGHDADGWQPGDAEILFDLQQQRMAMPQPDADDIPLPPAGPMDPQLPTAEEATAAPRPPLR